MSNVYYTQVLDEPYYIGNGEFLSVVTNGKVRHEGEDTRDYNKDAGARAGLLRINAENDSVDFVDFYEKSQQGDRYRGIAVVNNKAYVMRTQKDLVDSIVRVACVDLETNSVEMIEEKAISVHGTVTPKTFCGHFNFGRPINVEDKIIYPPLNSGMIIVFDTTKKEFVIHEVRDDFASMHSVFVPELNEVVFFPYGETTDKLIAVNLETNQIKDIVAPTKSSFYHVNTSNGKAVGAPLIMDGTEAFNFWIYNGNEIKSLEYTPINLKNRDGQLGFKYGTVNADVLYTHTCWSGCSNLVEVDLANETLTVHDTGENLGSKPIVNNESVVLFPSIQDPADQGLTNSVYTFSQGNVEKLIEVGTDNITSGPINDIDTYSILAPYRFDLVDNTLSSQLAVLNLNENKSKLLDVKLSLEPNV